MNCPSCGQTLDDASRFCKFCGAATQPAEAEDPSFSKVRAGDVFEGKWRIEAKLGQGGMGAVFLAHDVSLDRKVAIKILAGELCNDEEFVVRFEREAKLTANLEHPNIVPVYAVGKFGVRPFIVMKMLEGAPLSKHLRQFPNGMPADQITAIMRQLCDGLGFIHTKGFVHRDIKAGNIIISPTGHATILDFGILRDTKQSEGLTRAGVMMGTPHYMSPEQALGKPIDPRADLYALGCLTYELLVGKTPFQADNDFQIIAAHVKQAPPDPREANPALPAGVSAVVQKSLAKAADDRFQTAAELYQALEAALKPGPARRPTRVATAAATGSSPRTPTSNRRAGSYTLGSASPAGDSPTLSPNTPASTRRSGRIPQRRPAAPVDIADDQTAENTGVDSAPTPPRTVQPKPSAPAEPPKPEAPAAKKSGGGAVATLLIIVVLGGLGYVAFNALKEVQSGPEEVSTEIQPLQPPDEDEGARPPPQFAGAQPLQPPAQEEPPAPEPTEEAAPAVPQTPSEEPKVAQQKPRETKHERREPKRNADKQADVTHKADPTAKIAGAGDIGTLRVVTTQKSEPLWATLYVDGRRKGDTPLTFDLTSGSHTIALERGGYKRIEKQVVVAPGVVTVVKLELESEGG